MEIRRRVMSTRYAAPYRILVRPLAAEDGRMVRPAAATATTSEPNLARKHSYAYHKTYQKDTGQEWVNSRPGRLLRQES